MNLYYINRNYLEYLEFNGFPSTLKNVPYVRSGQIAGNTDVEFMVPLLPYYNNSLLEERDGVKMFKLRDDRNTNDKILGYLNFCKMVPVPKSDILEINRHNFDLYKSFFSLKDKWKYWLFLNKESRLLEKVKSRYEHTANRIVSSLDKDNDLSKMFRPLNFAVYFSNLYVESQNRRQAFLRQFGDIVDSKLLIDVDEMDDVRVFHFSNFDRVDSKLYRAMKDDYKGTFDKKCFHVNIWTLKSSGSVVQTDNFYSPKEQREKIFFVESVVPYNMMSHLHDYCTSVTKNINSFEELDADIGYDEEVC